MSSAYMSVAPQQCAPALSLSWKQKARDFAEGKIRPLVRQMDADGQFCTALIRDLFDSGFMGLEIPAAWKGQGASFLDAIHVIEELARVDPAVAVLVDVQNALVNTAILRWGSSSQRQQFLPLLASGMVGAYALSEQDAGSDAFSLTTRARKSGDHYVLTGTKKWTTNAAEAGLFLTFAAVESPADPRLISAFLVPRQSDGLEVGPREDKLGIRASSTCQLILDNVRVPSEHVLGQIGAGQRVAVETLNEGRIGIAAQMLGLAQGAFDAAAAYSQTRKQFGQAIAGFQAVQFQLADMATEIQATRLLVYDSVRLVKEKSTAPVERFRSAAMAKYFASKVAERTASKALEIFGGNGFCKNYPAEKFYRDAKIGSIYEGTSNIQLRTIAATILRQSNI